MAKKLLKVNLTRSISLMIADLTPGNYGKIIVKQDAIGNHDIYLPAGYKGSVNIEKAPNKATLLFYEVDDECVYVWNERIDPLIIVNPPAAITDLAVATVDSAGVTVAFTAPEGDEGKPDVKADRYKVYFSGAPINSNTILDYLPDLTHSTAPKAPGLLQSIRLNGLIPKQKFYVVIISEKITLGGQLKRSALSNVVSFTTLPLEQDINPQVLKRVPLKAENVFNYLALYDKDANGIEYSVENLVDYSTVTESDGEPQGVPSGIMKLLYGGRYRPDLYNMKPLKFFFELDSAWTIEKIFIHPDFGSQSVVFKTSVDGVNYLNAALFTSTNANVWNKRLVDPAAKSDVKYVRMDLDGPLDIRAVVFYGFRQQNQNISGKKFKRNYVIKPFKDKISTNAFLLEDIVDMAHFGKAIRFYNDHNWFLPENDPIYKVGGNPDINSMEYMFDNSRMWDFDAKFLLAKNNGLTGYFLLTDSMMFTAPTGTSEGSARFWKPLDPGLNGKNLAVTENPQNYRFHAQFFYQLAARYGSNASIPLNMLTLHSGCTPKVGLDLIKYVEFGNECDRWWMEEGHFSPNELAANISADYDGHKNTMGAGIGLKNADPNMVAVMPALAIAELGYFRALLLWWNNYRGANDYPIDVINIHHYNTNIGGQAVDAYNDVWAVHPETGELMGILKKWSDFRDEFLPGKQLWMTEIGYDEQYGGKIAPKDPNPTIRGLRKAQWLMRTFLLSDASGFDNINHFMWNSVHFLSDFNNNNADPLKFGTAGYVEGGRPGQTQQKLISYYYIKAFRAAIGGYTFSHKIREHGTLFSIDAVVETVNPNLFAYAYKNGNSSMIVLWLGTGTGSAIDVTIRVHASENQIQIQDFEGLHLSHHEVANETIVSPVAADNQKTITIVATETPKIIYTKNISVGRLINPEDILLQATSPTSVKLTWKDRNIGQNNTVIFQSDNSSSNFIQIFSGYIDDGTFVLNGLTEASTYYFRIQFIAGAITSDISDAYGILTKQSIPIPGSFNDIQTKPSTITLGWTYSDNDRNYIDNFEIYRSSTIAGIYNLLAIVSKSASSYQDFGLIESTTYYYKIRAVKAFDSSGDSLAISVTTQAATLQPPAVIDAKTNFAGDRVLLEFDIPLKDPTGNQSNFSVYRNGNVLINAISTEAHPVNAQKMYVYLETPIASSTDSVTISYNGQSGTMESIFDVKAAEIVGYAVSNLKGDESLVAKRVKVSFSATVATSGWNNMDVNYNQVQMDALDSTGNTTGYRLFVPKSGSTGFDGPTAAGTTPTAGDPINNLFPVAVRENGLSHAGYGTGGIVTLMNLPLTRDYDIKVFGSEWAGAQGIMEARANFTGSFKTLEMKGNIANYLSFTNLHPSNYVVPADLGSGGIPGIDSAKIVLEVKSDTQNRNISLMGIIIEEMYED